MTSLLDRHGTPLKVGQHVRIQVCVGPYGQTAIRQGVIANIDEHFRGITIKTDAAFHEYRGRFGRQDYSAGDLAYVVVEPSGYHKHNDVEHAHEKWTEVIP